MAEGPLAGRTVIDLTTALAGPYATLLLAGLGARVVKVENPRTGGDAARDNAPYVGAAGLTLARQAGDDMSVSMLLRGRNKHSVTLNLKHPKARDLLAGLVRQADVMVDNLTLMPYFLAKSSETVLAMFSAGTLYQTSSPSFCAASMRVRRAGEASAGTAVPPPASVEPHALASSRAAQAAAIAGRSREIMVPPFRTITAARRRIESVLRPVLADPLRRRPAPGGPRPKVFICVT
ncbi:MAG TPA: CoA transferase [Nonomuraea sp.]|nr:CoA transferase [Nonomuraea sp.]